MEDEFINEPLQDFKNKFKAFHEKNIEECFKKMLEKAQLNIKENQKTVTRIDECTKEINKLEKRIGNYKFLKGFAIFLLILIIVGIAVLLVLFFREEINIEKEVFLYASPSIPMLVILFMVIRKMSRLLKDLNSWKATVIEEKEEFTKEAYKQMEPLNNLFTNQQCLELLTKTLPLIQLDKSFDTKRYEYLVKNFGFRPQSDENRSTLFVRSGEIKGNPFFFARDLRHSLEEKEYTGSLVISYTTTSYENGKRVSRTNYQTLYASIMRPCPYYWEKTYLVYANEAAPNLSFSREDSDAEYMTEKQITKEVTKVEKKLIKQARKNLTKGSGLTLLANSEFEVLWGAKNRDNEVEFRMMFTPFAQKQLLELMKERVIGYGDNFDFEKNKMINTVIPEHLQEAALEINSEDYKHYDFEEIKQRFYGYNAKFFKDIYFAFAPLFAIPLYQQHMPHNYIYGDLYEGYESFYQHEMFVNKLNINYFKSPDSSTANILKSRLLKTENNMDTIEVLSHGYKTVPRTEYVSKRGADGRSHRVPVEWTEYIPVSKKCNVEIVIANKDEKIKQGSDEKYAGKFLFGNYLIRILK